MDLLELRSKINDIDSNMQQLFAERMKICYQIAEYKKERRESVDR